MENKDGYEHSKARISDALGMSDAAFNKLCRQIHATMRDAESVTAGVCALFPDMDREQIATICGLCSVTVACVKMGGITEE